MASLSSRSILGALGVLSLLSGACGGSPNGDGSSGGGSSGRGGSGAVEPGEPTPGGPGAGGSSGSSGSGGSGSDTPEVAPSAGCDSAPGLPRGEQSIEVDGATRTFIVDVPSDYDEGTPYPLLFGFHGRGFSAAEFRSASYGNLLSVAGDSAIVVHPDALGEAELAWDVESLDDVRFFDALLEELTSELCVDESRVFAAGHSSGAYFVNLLGCVRGDSLRAIAPVAGGGPFGSGGGSPSCEGPLSAWIAHAEDDETVLFQNGENSRDYWLESDSCSTDSFDDVTPSPCVAYEGCDAGLAVNWCVYDGGHDWPSFGARGIWSFFERL
jgi:poly(3-hydroxybutyrate) depolymerase